MKSARDRTNLGSTSLPASTNFLIAVVIAILLSACGGGGGESKTGVVGTGDPNPPADALTASGPLTAVGTAGIGATGLDDRAAAIFINTQAGQSFTALKLGMVAEVAGTIPTTAASISSGTANNIVVQSAAVGTVTMVDLSNQRFSLGIALDQGVLSVQIDQNTIFEGFSSLSNLSVHSRIEVYGIALVESDSSRANSILATRLIVLPNVSDPAQFELLGTATNVSPFQFNLRLGSVRITTSGVTAVTMPTGSLPGTSSITDNTRVRVLGNLNPLGGTRAGQIHVYSIDANQIVAGIPVIRNDNAIIVLDGVIQSIGTNGRFRLNDTDVDPPAANAASVAVGARVQVKGRKTAGVLTATDFRLIATGERIQYTVQGDITSFISTANFTVRGESINASTATIVGGTAANLANGRTVRVKAQTTNGHLVATEVTLL